MINSIITGTGCCIPDTVVRNSSFLTAQFFGKDGEKLYQSNQSIIEKFKSVTGIEERRYATQDQNASDLGYIAAAEAIETAAIDKESLDYLIVAHNFGDVAFESNRVSQVPSIASRIKARLEIHNPDCVAYDIAFGCPGWVEALIQANCFIKSGTAKRCLVVGAETLSRIIDVHDRDSMIFSDGAGAVVLEATTSGSAGIMAHKSQTYAVDYTHVLAMHRSCSPYVKDKSELFLKMQGRKVYEFALKHVPVMMKELLDKAGITIDQVSKILLHQANEKMDKAIVTRLFQLYERAGGIEQILPMTIKTLGNSSVATVPTMLDLLLKGKLTGHTVRSGDILVLASVGAGMNINALIYQV
jgi:3-oxoacyl-[acyl-carrier-protein] synthase-3